ncbi:hypothetical protein [Streptomyces sp. NPDC001966]
MLSFRIFIWQCFTRLTSDQALGDQHQPTPPPDPERPTPTPNTSPHADNRAAHGNSRNGAAGQGQLSWPELIICRPTTCAATAPTDHVVTVTDDTGTAGGGSR